MKSPNGSSEVVETGKAEAASEGPLEGAAGAGIAAAPGAAGAGIFSGMGEEPGLHVAAGAGGFPSVGIKLTRASRRASSAFSSSLFSELNRRPRYAPAVPPSSAGAPGVGIFPATSAVRGSTLLRCSVSVGYFRVCSAVKRPPAPRTFSKIGRNVWGNP